MTRIRGVTWAHTRGFAPLAALGRVWEDRNPGDEVVWTARSLKSFGEDSLEQFLDDYDLLVYDYPFAGEALAQGWVHPLETLIPDTLLTARRDGTIGPLHDAFTVDGRQAALAIDVATHVCAARHDLLALAGYALPQDWSETLALARATGKVAMPMRPTGVWGAFLTMCASAGDQPFKRPDGMAFDATIAADALHNLQELATLVDPSCLELYPTTLLDRMAQGDAIAFMPLLYGYANYATRGYAANIVTFHDPKLGRSPARGAILGGAGIGISARSPHPEKAAAIALWLTDPTIQASLYVAMGGQPAQRAAWLDPWADAYTSQFFSNTRASAESPYVRPNGPGFHTFQNKAAGIFHKAVSGRRGISDALNEVSGMHAALVARLGAD